MVKLENISESGPTTSTCFAKTIVFSEKAPLLPTLLLSLNRLWLKRIDTRNKSQVRPVTLPVITFERVMDKQYTGVGIIPLHDV